jgi:hypothetical protein
MDNREQVEEIRKYQSRLSGLTGKDIPAEMAAWLWIRKYAKVWRLRHPVCQPAGIGDLRDEIEM